VEFQISGYFTHITYGSRRHVVARMRIVNFSCAHMVWPERPNSAK